MRDHAAVVVGAGMAGLLSASVLVRHLGPVLVVDRDELPDGAQPRRGVPQGRQLHARPPAPPRWTTCCPA